MQHYIHMYLSCHYFTEHYVYQLLNLWKISLAVNIHV